MFLLNKLITFLIFRTFLIYHSMNYKGLGVFDPDIIPLNLAIVFTPSIDLLCGNFLNSLL